MTTGDLASSKRVETQIMQFDGRQWNGYTYAWNAEQTDAELVPASGLEKAYLLKDPSVQGRCAPPSLALSIAHSVPHVSQRLVRLRARL